MMSAMPAKQREFTCWHMLGVLVLFFGTIIGVNIWLFILCSIIARGGRFFVVAILLNRYGEWIRAQIEKRLGMWVAIGAIVLVLGFVVALKLI